MPTLRKAFCALIRCSGVSIEWRTRRGAHLCKHICVSTPCVAFHTFHYKLPVLGGCLAVRLKHTSMRPNVLLTWIILALRERSVWRLWACEGVCERVKASVIRRKHSCLYFQPARYSFYLLFPISSYEQNLLEIAFREWQLHFNWTRVSCMRLEFIFPIKDRTLSAWSTRVCARTQTHTLLFLQCCMSLCHGSLSCAVLLCAFWCLSALCTTVLRVTVLQLNLLIHCAPVLWCNLCLPYNFCAFVFLDRSAVWYWL